MFWSIILAIVSLTFAGILINHGITSRAPDPETMRTLAIICALFAIAARL